MKRGKRREARGKKKNMEKRITLWLLATLFLANVSLADAQQPGKIFRIGFLDQSTASGSAVLLKRWFENPIHISHRGGRGQDFDRSVSVR